MDLHIKELKFGVRENVTIPDRDFYKVVGEEGIRKMVSRHYDLLIESSIKNIFPIDDRELEQSKTNSADFMIQICGGPDYFNQHRGRPRMADRHKGFSITSEGRIVWLNCYKQALLELEAPDHLTLSFWEYINIFSNWMVNTQGK
jgi:hemoglobin